MIASSVLAINAEHSMVATQPTTKMHMPASAPMPPLIANARLVIGGKRHLALADGLPNGELRAWPSPLAESIPEILAHRGEPVAVLASGDPYATPANDDAYLYADMLNLLAHQTGGRYYSIEGPDDLKEACAEIAEDLRYQYVLGFETAATGTPAHRKIAVTVKGRKVKQVTHRKGYRGLPPAAR